MVRDPGKTLNEARSTRSQSYVVRWAEQNAERIRHTRDCDITPEHLFIAFINTLTTFCEPNPRHEADTLEFDVRERFSNDAAFFELGCYMCVRLDTWLFLERPHLRQRIALAFGKGFVTLFTAALQIPNVSQLIQQRMEIFAAMGRSEPDIDSCYNPLMQLLLRTDGDEKPRSYVLDKEPVVIADFFEHRALQREVIGWVTGFLPALINMMEAGTDIIDKHAHEG